MSFPRKTKYAFSKRKNRFYAPQNILLSQTGDAPPLGAEKALPATSSCVRRRAQALALPQRITLPRRFASAEQIHQSGKPGKLPPTEAGNRRPPLEAILPLAFSVKNDEYPNGEKRFATDALPRTIPPLHRTNRKSPARESLSHQSTENLPKTEILSPPTNQPKITRTEISSPRKTLKSNHPIKSPLLLTDFHTIAGRQIWRSGRHALPLPA